jgi:hypothetical protein
VFTLLEILSYPTFYDSDHKKFVDLVSDNRIVVATYVQLARDIASDRLTPLPQTLREYGSDAKSGLICGG